MKLVRRTFSPRNGISHWVTQQTVTENRGKENANPANAVDRLKRESTSYATALSSQQKGPRKQKGRTHRQPTAKGSIVFFNTHPSLSKKSWKMKKIIMFLMETIIVQETKIYPLGCGLRKSFVCLSESLLSVKVFSPHILWKHSMIYKLCAYAPS